MITFGRGVRQYVWIVSAAAKPPKHTELHRAQTGVASIAMAARDHRHIVMTGRHVSLPGRPGGRPFFGAGRRSA